MLPDCFLERPFLFSHLAGAWRAFWILHKRRPSGLGVSAIPLAEFQSYCEIFGVREHDRRRMLLEHIDVLDQAYLAWNRAQATTNEKTHDGRRH